MKKLLDLLFSHEVFSDHPPVLLDIGASGESFPQWKSLMPYSHCITFEADDREISDLSSTNGSWMKLTSFPTIVTTDDSVNQKFYLTKSPFCSSTLLPNMKSLSNWNFASLFEISETSLLKATNLNKILSKSNISYIDWFKTDSQGTDLRLFACLPENLRSSILAADFEPGIIDAYVGEDKLHHLLAYMDHQPFWVNSMIIKGAKRITNDELTNLSNSKIKEVTQNLKNSPCWCEVSYLIIWILI